MDAGGDGVLFPTVPSSSTNRNVVLRKWRSLDRSLKFYRKKKKERKKESRKKREAEVAVGLICAKKISENGFEKTKRAKTVILNLMRISRFFIYH